MTEKPIDLDLHRGLSAQRATESRRRNLAWSASTSEISRRRAEAEDQLFASPAATWEEAAMKARYLLKLYAEESARGDARTKKLIEAVLEDFERLSGSVTED